MTEDPGMLMIGRNLYKTTLVQPKTSLDLVCMFSSLHKSLKKQRGKDGKTTKEIAEFMHLSAKPLRFTETTPEKSWV
jgi:hypothetical protein